MAGFNDFIGALRFGMGLVSGFTAQAEKERQANEAKQLRLLQLLKDDEHELVELPYAQIQPSGNFLDVLFGTGQARVSGTEEPAILIGNRGFVRRAYAPISIPKELLETTKSTTQPAGIEPTYTPPVRPFAPAAPTLTAPRAVMEPAGSTSLPTIPAQLQTQILSAVLKAAEETGVPVAQLLALAHVESSFNPQAEATSTDPKTGKVYKAQGLMQLIEETQQRRGVIQPFDIDQSILGGAQEWKDALDKTGGDLKRAYLEVYNPNDPNRFKAAARLQQLVGMYEQSPKVQALVTGRFAGPGAVASEQEARRQGAKLVVSKPDIIGYTAAGRPIVRNPDGSVSTERTITVTDPLLNGGKPTVIPSMFNGVQVSQEEAIKRIVQAGGKDPETGELLPVFSTIEEAERGAQARHIQQEKETQVASREASSLPAAPKFGEISLPAARTLEDYTKQEQRRAYTTLAPTLRNTAKGREKLGVALRDAETKAQTLYDRDFKSARAEADRIKRERQIHSFEVLNALDRVKDPDQLKVILDYAAKNPDPDHLGDSVQMLAQAKTEDLPALMGRLYPQLLQANYSESQIRYAWKNFEQKAELPGKVALEEATQRYGIEYEAYASQMFANKPYRALKPEEQAQVITRVQDDKLALASAQKSDTPLPAELVTRIGASDYGVRLANDIYQMFEPIFTGPIAGRVGTVRTLLGLTDDQEAQFRQSALVLAEMIIRSRTGAQASEAELKRSLAQMPDVNDPPNVFLSELKAVTRQLIGQRESISAGIAATRKEGGPLQPKPLFETDVPQKKSAATNDTTEQAALRSQLKAKGWTDEQINKAIGR